MATIAGFGDTIFAVSSLQVMTFDKYERTVKHKFAEHQILNSINLLESVGLENEEITMSITLSKALGVDPKDEADTLRAMCRDGEVNFLIIGYDVVGACEWVIESVKEKGKAFDGMGELILSELDVTFKQYGERDDSLVNDVEIAFAKPNSLYEFLLGKVKDWLKL